MPKSNDIQIHLTLGHKDFSVQVINLKVKLAIAQCYRITAVVMPHSTDDIDRIEALLSQSMNDPTPAKLHWQYLSKHRS